MREPEAEQQRPLCSGHAPAGADEIRADPEENPGYHGVTAPPVPGPPKIMNTSMRTLLVASSLFFAACGQDAANEPPVPPTEANGPAEGDAPAEANAEPAAEEPAAEPAPAAEAAGPRVNDESFVLELRGQEQYTAGALAQVGVHIDCQGDWHLNEDFPTSVQIEAVDGLGLAQTSLNKGGAAEFGESSARFDVPFTPTAAGEHQVQARVSFAVCSEQSCVPKTHTVALAVNVQDAS